MNDVRDKFAGPTMSHHLISTLERSLILTFLLFAVSSYAAIRFGLMSIERSKKSVLKGPGSTTMTLIPSGSTSFLNPQDNPSRAHLAAP